MSNKLVTELEKSNKKDAIHYENQTLKNAQLLLNQRGSKEREILKDAKALEEAGCWSIVLEGIPLELADKITHSLKIPTIGIASGPLCDGQVLVIYDLLGMNPEFTPRFVKHYADLGKLVPEAVKAYVEEVKSTAFPAEEHSYRRNLIPISKKEKAG